MNEKLCTYAQSNLPGGIYWDPPEEVRIVLSGLKPSNDLCELILGLNDYLVTAIPNLHQDARSNMTQVKKNKTIKWLDELPEKQQLEVVELAVEMKLIVELESKKKSELIKSKRREKLIHAHTHLENTRKKNLSEKNQLSQLHLITTSEELHEAISNIYTSITTATKQKKELHSLLMNQVKIRKKVLGQNISIKFSQAGKQRPFSEIIEELSAFIDQNSVTELSPYVKDPSTLMGKRISHKFQLEDSEELLWYCGTVIEYDPHEKMHKILYDEEDEYCWFDVLIDNYRRLKGT